MTYRSNLYTTLSSRTEAPRPNSRCVEDPASGAGALLAVERKGKRMTHEEEAARLVQCTVSIWEALEALEAAAQAAMDEVAEIRATLPEFPGPIERCRTDKIVTHGE